MLPRLPACLLLACPLFHLPAQQFTLTPIAAPLPGPQRVYPGDFDGDGTLDLLVVSWYPFPVTQVLSVWSRLPNGSWGSRAETGLGAIGSVVIAELTGDGRPDVLLTRHSPGPTWTSELTLFTFSRRMERTQVWSIPWLMGTGLAWLRGDADVSPDLFSGDGTTMWFHRYLGGGVFAPPVTTPITVPGNAETGWWDDFTGDGFADVVIIDRVPPRVIVHPGDGTGSFLPAVITPLPFYLPGGVPSIAAELNGDSLRDLIVQGRVLLGSGVGAFQTTATVLPGTPRDSGDFDGDGRTDVLCEFTPGLVAFLQQPGMTFVAGPSTSVGYDERHFVLDVTQDGRLDILRLHSSTTGMGKATLAEGVLPHSPPFVWPFSIGTPGCRGHVALSANADPVPASPQFALVATNAPTSSPGVLITYLGSQPTLGTDPLGLGFVVHLPIFNPYTTTVAFDTNSYGQARLPVPIPPTMFFTALFQACWLAPGGDGACSESPFGFVSSNALLVQVH